jgi:hypothetical protein
VHVHTVIPLSAASVWARFDEIGTQTPGLVPPLVYAKNRMTPRFLLPKAPFVPSASAEVSVLPRADGTEVVLRLLWGPFPAPVPRALVGFGLLLGILTLTYSQRGSGVWAVAMLVIFLPLAALHRQQEGEQELQARLSSILDSTPFVPKPH